MSRPENPLAFPASTDGFGNFLKGTPGMELRDFFAAHALGGILASGAGEDDCDRFRRIIADDAFAYADAMLLARTPNEIGETS